MTTMTTMFERFTERARHVIVLAQEEARSLRHHTIGTEHLLLGILAEGEGIAARALVSCGLSREGVRAEIVRLVGEGREEASGPLPFTPRAKRVCEHALREALGLGHNYIATEHLLLGLVRENEGVAARILLDFDTDSEKVRREVIRILGKSLTYGRQPTAAVEDPVAAEAPNGILGPNHALLCGEVLGVLMHRFHAEPEHDDDGNYTGRAIISRPSGTWAVTVTPETVVAGGE